MSLSSAHLKVWSDNEKTCFYVLTGGKWKFKSTLAEKVVNHLIVHLELESWSEAVFSLVKINFFAYENNSYWLLTSLATLSARVNV